jgi:glycosyltransferase involved in cell wall biosynthesis
MDGELKKVLYISYDGMTDPLGQSQVLPYLRGISAAGYEIHLISFEKPTRYEAHRKVIKEYCDASNIKWHPQDYSHEGGLRRTIRQIFHLQRVVKYLHKRHQFDIAHCRSYIAAMSGVMLQKKYGVNFIFDMRGFWPDERVDGNLWNLKNPLYKMIYNYFKKKEKQFIQKADAIVSLTHKGKKEILKWPVGEGCDNKISVIPCCVDLDLFDSNKLNSMDQESMKSTLGITSDDYILGYVGSIGTWYMLSEMLDYFKSILDKKPNAKFLFVSGENPETIKSQAKNKGIATEKILIKSVLHKDVPLMMSLFDSSIFFIRSTFSKKASSPTKQGELMAMGIPLVCNSGIGDTDGIVEKYNAGVAINDFSQRTFEENIIDPADYDSQDIIRGAKEYFSLDAGVERYLNIYKTILEDK